MKRQKSLYNKHSLFIFIVVLLLCGFMLGVLLSKYIDIKDTNNMKYYLSVLIDVSDPKNYFITQFMIAILTIFIITLLGTSILGIPFIAFLLFTKGVQIGYSCALFVLTYSLKGILGILLVFIPQIVLDVIAIYFISHFSLLFSLNLIYACSNKQKISLNIRINKLLNVLLISVIIVFISSYIKSTLALGLIKFFNSL